MTPHKPSLISNIMPPLAVILLLTYLRYAHNVLLFHTFAELFSVMVGVLMLVVVWNARHLTQNHFLTFLGIGYFWIAVLDTFHTFTMTGMLLFDSDNFEITIHFWIYTRILEALLLLTAIRYLKNVINHQLAFVGIGIISAAIIWLSFNNHQPQLMSEDGLTTPKIVAEIFVMLVLAVTLLLYYSNRKYISPRILNYFYASITLTIFAEIAFTIFTNINGAAFFVGHLLKFLSFWMIYKAIIETSLQEPLAMMSKAFNSYDSIPHPSVVIDENAKISRLNRAAIELTKEPAEHLIGKSVHDYFHPESGFPDNCALCQELQKQESIEGDLIYYPEFERWYIYSLAKMTVGNKTIGMVQSMTDVTERKQIEDELNYQKEQLRILFENTTTGLALCTLDGRFIKVNKTFARILGRSVTEIQELSYWQITPDKFNKQEQQQLETLKTTGAYGPYLKEYIHKEGHTVPVESKGTLFEQNGVEYIWSIVDDISERAESERRLRQAEKMDAIGQLSGGIAHDFNNILGVILGNIEIVKAKLSLQPEIDKYLSSIEKAGLRAANLTDQLLDYSKKKADKQELVNVGALVSNMHNLIERSLTPDIAVELHVDDNLALLEMVPGEFQDALLNLIINARDAMDGRGHINLSLENCELDDDFCRDYPDSSPGEYVRLSLTDTGKGIDEEEISRIFEPFYSTKNPSEATGMGLAMVFSFMTRSHGIITCESTPNVGTTFNLYFPVSHRHVSSTQKDVADDTPKGNHQLILVVDDEVALLALTKEQLDMLHYQVITTTSPQEALEMIDKHKEIALLMTDIVMPGGMNGYELVEMALKKQPDLDYLLCSGYTSEAIEKSKHIKLKHPILQKPYNQTDLAIVIDRILNS